MGRALGWLVVLALGAYSLVGRDVDAEEGSTARRLWGPFAGIAARVQWVRVHGAMVDDRPDLVWQRARTAIELDPGATDGYLMLARHLLFDRASLVREPDAARRLAWMRAGLEVAERGEANGREPGALALWLGLARVRMARDESLGAARGPGELLGRAAGDFERAAAAGDPDAAELAAEARRLAKALGTE